MAKQGPINLPSFIGDDARWRLWIQGIHDACVAIGLVQTADTGQINPATAVRPAINTSGGYEIWRFNDALQATMPVFIRIDYRLGQTQDRPGLGVNVATGTNGAGTLTGQIGNSRFSVPATSRPDGENLPLYASGGDGYAVLLTGVGSVANVSSHCFGFHVERPRDPQSGARLGESVYWHFYAPGGSNGWQVIPDAGSVPLTQSSTPPAIMPSVGEFQAGAEVAVCPLFIPSNGRMRVCTGHLCYAIPSIGELTPFDVDLFGGPHTYLPIGDGLAGLNSGFGSPTNCSVAIPWE